MYNNRESSSQNFDRQFRAAVCFGRRGQRTYIIHLIRFPIQYYNNANQTVLLLLLIAYASPV
jgi:hypothetical protein